MIRYRSSALVVALVAVAACGIEDTGPIALDDRIVTEPGATVIHDVLLNDRAPAGGALVLESVRGGSGSVVVLDERRVEYTAPATGETDSFIYVAVSGDGVRVEARVEIVIAASGSTTVAPTTTAGGSTTTTPTSVPTTTDPGTSPRLVDPELGFGTVAIGAVATRSVTIIGDDEPWTPDFSDFDLIPDVRVDQACGEIAPGEQCEVDVTWTPTSSGALDRTPRLRDDVPLRVFGTAQSLELRPMEQERPTQLVKGGSIEAQVEIVAPSSDPVAIAVALEGAPEGATIDPRCEIVEGSCTIGVRMPTDRFLIGSNDPVDVIVRTSANEIRGTVTVVGTLAQPEWITPSAGQRVWFDLLLRGITVEIAPVTGADDYEVVGQLCGGAECRLPLLVDRAGDSTMFFVGSPDLAQLQAVYDAIVDAGLEPTLELTATAIAGDDTSLPATVVVPLTDGPMIARWAQYEPDSPAFCPDLRTTLDIESFTLTVTEVVARHVNSDPDVTFTVLSNPAVVAPGTDTVTFETSSLEMSFDTIQLEVVGVPSSAVLVDGVTGYEANSCVD